MQLKWIYISRLSLRFTKSSMIKSDNLYSVFSIILCNMGSLANMSIQPMKHKEQGFYIFLLETYKYSNSKLLLSCDGDLLIHLSSFLLLLRSLDLLLFLFYIVYIRLSIISMSFRILIKSAWIFWPFNIEPESTKVLML